MKRKTAFWTVLLVLMMGIAWWSLPAWIGQPEETEWSLTPVAPAVNTEEESITEAVAAPLAETITEWPAELDEQVVEPQRSVEDASATEAEVVDQAVSPPPIPQSGELEFRVRDKVQGRERYTFTRLEDGGLQAFAEGKFFFEIAYIPLELAYRQLLQLDAALAPVQYATELRGPLGLGNSDTRIDFGPQQAVMITNGTETIIPVPTPDMLAINMFATFSLLTQWFEVGQREATFMALDAGGFEDNATLSEGGFRFGEMRLERMDDIGVQTGDEQIQLQRYRIDIDGPQDGFQVLFYEGRWAGMWGEATDDGGGYFTVYHTDLFPNGFDVIVSGEGIN